MPNTPRFNLPRLACRSALIAGTLLIAPAVMAQNVPITFGTNWIAQAEHGGFYQSVADGTYAACGLDVTIVPGGPGVNNVALMMAGRTDFYMGGHLDAFFGIVQGVPLVNVASMFQKEPQVLLTHPGRVSSFAELTQLTVMTSDGAPYWEWMKSAYGFADDQREAYTFSSAPFIVNVDSAMQGYLSSEPFAVERETGWAPDVWLIADAGYNSYSTTIQTMQDTVATRPEVVKCFVEGSIIGWYNYMYNDNSAANAMILADNPEMTQEAIDYAITKMTEAGIVDSGDALTLGIGAMTDERNQSFYDNMVAAGVIEAGLDISSAYTLEFVNQGLGMDLKPAP